MQTLCSLYRLQNEKLNRIDENEMWFTKVVNCRVGEWQKRNNEPTRIESPVKVLGFSIYSFSV